MARSAKQINNAPGIAAATFVVVAVLLAFVGIGLRVDALSGLGLAEWQAIRFTILQSLLSAFLSCALAVPVARALARRRFWGRTFLITLLGAPFILPVIVAMLGLLAIFGRSGVFNDILAMLGIAKISIYGLQGVVLAHVFFNLPLAIRLLVQGWQGVPAERFRLSAQLGIGPGMMFRLIELPLLLRILPGAFALIFVICLTSFAVALTLGGGPRATTIELAIYQAFRFDFNLGRAGLLSLVQLFVAGGAALLAFCLVPSISFGGGMDRMQCRWDGQQGRGAKILDNAFICVAAVFLILPLLAILTSGLRGLVEVPLIVWSSAWTSLWVALLSVLVLLGVALPMAGWIASSGNGRMEIIGLLGLSISPLMIGTGWFILIYPYANPADLALLVTIAVNAMMALPFALRILVPSIRDTIQAYGRLSSALGISGFAMWRCVLLLRSRPQIGFAAGLTAALSVGDLGVIALFGDPDRSTLPLQMYRLMGSYRTDAAAGAALILLLLAFGLFWIMDYWGRRNAIAQ